MKRIALLSLGSAFVTALSAAEYRPDFARNLGFTIYTNNPPGKQLSGVYKAVDTPPQHPRETEKKFKVPKGFEVRLFASEPEIVNPVAMTWDDRGRLWVLELYEYPKGAPNGQKGRDRIKILEDTDADGQADKVTVFAEGYSLATGLALGHGGVYLGAAPNLYFLKDTNGDDRADQTTILKTGFGLEDRHELLNGFAWGPDGALYMTHGVFTHSKVKDPNNPEDDGVKMDAALARFDPITKRFEVFADGTSNPWGVDWNERGDAFVSACVIHHLFHMAPGGQYNRQGGTWPNPYGYVGDLSSKGLPAIVDWRHFRAAHAGICVYQGDQWPAEWRGLVLLGNIHQSALNCDRLTPLGATYSAEKETKLLGADQGTWNVGAGNFLVCDDHWFRPVSSQTGPDGALWVMDWSDKYPCYQNAQADPEGVDRELGRIWRVVWVGDQPGRPIASRREKALDLGKAPNATLVELLTRGNIWERRQTQRVLRERFANSRSAMVNVENQLISLARRKNNPLHARLAALWSMPATVSEPAIGALAGDSEPVLRAWAARLIGEAQIQVKLLDKLAGDKDPTVRAAAATAIRQMTAGALTVGAKDSAPTRNLQDEFKTLLGNPSVSGDSYYPHIVWMSMEPRVAQNPSQFFSVISAGDNSVSAYCARRIMRRICDLTDSAARTKHLNAGMSWLAELAGKPGLAEAALDGLIDAFKSKGQPPTIPLEPIFAKLTANPKLAEKARRLATLLGDTSASRSLIAQINDTKASVTDRLKGIQAARETKDDVAKGELLKLLKNEKSNQTLLAEAIRALAVFGGDEIGYAMTDVWKSLTVPTRRTAADVLVTRSKWSRALMAAIDQKVADPQDVSATARRALANSADSTVVDQANRLLGKYRATGQDKLKLIAEKRTVALATQGDSGNGHEVAKRACFVCHKLYGEGADVGPDLTGVGRSTLDALLHNIIDPNEVVGNGYGNTEVELKDGRSVSGRIVEETPSRLRLVASGPMEHNIARSEIAEANGKPAIRTSELSLMPEGLEQMPDQDFRDLIWYLLNPPGDNRPWSPALRRELLGDENAGLKKRAAAQQPVDMESVALWNPEWRVNCPPFEGTPAKLSEYHGRRNVLVTHPINRTTPSALERMIRVPEGGAVIRFAVAGHEKGDWELRVSVGKELLHRQVVERAAWKQVAVDLKRFAGKEIVVRLENAANDWDYEFGYWSGLELDVRPQDTAAALR
ncbi:MAG TPA: PVC-type heme-binding CxxCH protein [Verrucomicrobiae bacterium]|nr:PVC-type heme-binding CxxCH protein [Verrucomicrobiae bacterium]